MRNSGALWISIHWWWSRLKLFSLVHRSQKSRERERRGKSVLRSHRGSSSPDTTTKQDLFGYTTTIRPLLLLLPKFQAIRSWRSGWRLPRKSSTNAKKKEHGGYMMSEYVMKWGWYLEYVIRIEYTLYMILRMCFICHKIRIYMILRVCFIVTM